MSPKSKRRWFQIHLSTAIMVMLTAAILLRANLVVHRITWVQSENVAVAATPNDGYEGKSWWAGYSAGWPLIFANKDLELANVLFRYGKVANPESQSYVDPAAPQLDILDVLKDGWRAECSFYLENFGANVLIGLMILLATSLGLELITRRFRRSSTPQPRQTISSA